MFGKNLFFFGWNWSLQSESWENNSAFEIKELGCEKQVEHTLEEESGSLLHYV